MALVFMLIGVMIGLIGIPKLDVVGSNPIARFFKTR